MMRNVVKQLLTVQRRLGLARREFTARATVVLTKRTAEVEEVTMRETTAEEARERDEWFRLGQFWC